MQVKTFICFIHEFITDKIPRGAVIINTKTPSSIFNQRLQIINDFSHPELTNSRLHPYTQVLPQSNAQTQLKRTSTLTAR